ncbi:SRPBCC domain-containing protein [uncultured Chitinophaga sp.]|jgi:Activator of Hsp90 ATPase homolog 1-like protein.|uniref:SRPBCC family protein n=1 Tax=uncultured Chitinophaga sp. TaxID=339340 RepID=UPI00262FAED0|nr:SRPBCC domain-containing protein [uncultured Chitinophaga sp.]
MQKKDWSQFTLRIPVNASIQEIYDRWTSSGGLESFFLRQALFTSREGAVKEKEQRIAPGDTYEWRWFGFPDSVTETGNVLAANGKDFLQFIFGKAGTVSVRIKTMEGVTVVELTQENIPTDEDAKFNYHIGCQGGWLFYLVNLKSLMEGGIDLRNRNEKLTAVINS